MVAAATVSREGNKYSCHPKAFKTANHTRLGMLKDIVSGQAAVAPSETSLEELNELHLLRAFRAQHCQSVEQFKLSATSDNTSNPGVVIPQQEGFVEQHATAV